MAQVKPVNKKKMSKSSLIAVIVAAVILLGFLLSLVAGTGIFFRVKKGASSDNFEVNASMMEYFANSYYQNWYSQNYYYILLGYLSFDNSVPLNEQYTDSSKTQTYYDYFVTGTKTTVQTYLKYCEAAKADSTVDFVQLEKDAQQYAKDSIKSLKEAAKTYSQSYYEQYGQTVTFEEYLRSNFGQHVNQSDLKKALIIENIASSYYQIVYDRIQGTVDDAREDKYFEDNLSTFVKAEYLVYSLTSQQTVTWPKAEDYVGGAESAAYKAAIDGKKAEEAAKIKPEDYEGGEESAAYKEAYKTAETNKMKNAESLEKDKSVIERLAAATTPEEFKRIILDNKYDSSFDSAYNTATKDYKTEEKPSEAALNAYKTEELKKAIIDAVLAGDDDIVTSIIKVDELKKLLLGEKYQSNFDEAYKNATKDFADDKKPSEDALKEYNSEELKNAIIEAALKGEGNVDETLIKVAEGSSTEWTAAAKELPKAIVEALKKLASNDKWLKATTTLPKSIITNLNTVITNATKTGTHTLTSELGKKLFGGVKAEYGIEYEENETQGTSAAVNTAWEWDMLVINVENAKTSVKLTEDAIAELEEEIAAETDADAKATLEASKKTLETSLESAKKTLETAEEKLANVEKTSEYSYSAYFVTEAAHRDEYKLRNVGHILFKVDTTKDTDPAVSYKTKEEAKAAAEALLEQIKAACGTDGTISKEKFEEFGAKTHDSNVFYDDVNKGDMVEAFEEWLFAATKEGEIGLVETTYGWHVMYFGGEGEEPAWRVTANEGATNEDIGTWYEELPSYGIEFNEDIFATIFGVEESHEGHNH